MLAAVLRASGLCRITLQLAFLSHSLYYLLGDQDRGQEARLLVCHEVKGTTKRQGDHCARSPWGMSPPQTHPQNSCYQISSSCEKQAGMPHSKLCTQSPTAGGFNALALSLCDLIQLLKGGRNRNICVNDFQLSATISVTSQDEELICGGTAQMKPGEGPREQPLPFPAPPAPPRFPRLLKTRLSNFPTSPAKQGGGETDLP